MQLLLKNSDDKPSLSFTMVYTAFIISLVWFGLSIFKIPHVKDFDVTIVTGFLTPLMALYFGRRWNESKNSSSEESNTTNPQS
jgi:hypothetical protein